ncbi:hypothetical protein [Legionella drancourtii]|uniref:Uncharacterized protein n=1 Tax=Legionella drancourtii LLAP12 TaxID=658187 RepID=G9EQS8_9GAMM|nr:hypothetical protein [Legionella drancourtii]EHL30299.1 hypothetical protein LDG_7631 [Legionella drancourtii LLAP12]
MDLAQKKPIIKRYLKETQRQFKIAPIPVQLRVLHAQEDRLSLINLLAELEDEWSEEYNALIDQAEVTRTVPPPTTVMALEPLQEGITVTNSYPGCATGR